MEFEPMLTPREKSPLPENVPRGVSNPRHFGSEPKHYQLSYSGPPQEPVNAQIRGRKCSWTGHTLRQLASNITRQAV